MLKEGGEGAHRDSRSHHGCMDAAGDGPLTVHMPHHRHSVCAPTSKRASPHRQIARWNFDPVMIDVIAIRHSIVISLSSQEI